jgi:hypothetical protein
VPRRVTGQHKPLRIDVQPHCILLQVRERHVQLTQRCWILPLRRHRIVHGDHGMPTRREDLRVVCDLILAAGEKAPAANPHDREQGFILRVHRRRIEHVETRLRITWIVDLVAARGHVPRKVPSKRRVRAPGIAIEDVSNRQSRGPGAHTDGYLRPPAPKRRRPR